MSRLLLDVRLGKLICLTWFVINVLDAQRISLSDTVTKARCIANCYTMTASHNNDSEKTCQNTDCQECLSPCEDSDSYSSETQCLQTCLNSSSCKASCRGLTHIRNLSSIFNGDGSTSPTPGIPTVTNKTFTSVSLKWDPVRNATGTAVYLIAMYITGDKVLNLPYYFVQVFTTPQATIETESLCALVDSVRRNTFDGLYYKFRIAVLTENSSISYGAQTSYITLPQPAPVSNITSPSFEYESARSNRKLKLTASWTPPEQSQHVSSYAMIWDHQCTYETAPVSPLWTATGSTHPNGSINLDEEMKKCNHTLKVYALSQCIPSNAAMITYEYPGCRNITSYPKDLCYKFDPPDSPDDYREVRNVSYTMKSISDAYTFTFNVTWEPPIYPHKLVESYNVIWKEKGWIFKSKKSHVTSYLLGPWKPGKIYEIRLLPNFEDKTPSGTWIVFNISTPDIDPHDLTVRNLVLDHFTFSPQTGKFDLNVTWQKPSFNYSQISSYTLSYQVNEGDKIMKSTDKPYYTIYGILHGEPIAVNITPKYNPGHSWIKGKAVMGKSNAPDPDPSQVTVRSLVLNDFTLKHPTRTFSLNVTWQKPLFQYSITSYAISYRVDNGKENKMQTNNTNFNIDGISYGQPVAFNVTPQYNNSRIRAVTTVKKTNAPVPPDEETSVQELQRTGDFVEDKKTNTYAINFTWKPPSFQYRDVLYYNLSYKFSGYPGDHSPCSSLVKDPRCTITDVKETRFLLSGILPQDRVIIEVTPIYDDKYILGKKQTTEDVVPGPREELLTVVGLRHDALVPSSNELFRTKVSWKKPLFNHSEVHHYHYKITNGTEKPVRNVQRRAIEFDTYFITNNTNVTIDGIELGKAIEFKVTPVFVVYMVNGREASIPIYKAEIGEKESSSMTPGETAGLVIGLVLLILIVICSMIFCHRERQRKMEAKGLVSGKNALMIDHWEVDGNLVFLEQELGDGAFGKVYKGALKEHIPPSQKLSLKMPLNTSRTSTIKGNEVFTVAVKMLHDMADSDQRREFFDEIQLMKAVGSHKNIVNMLGCCTVQEPMFLLVEYVPFGDLLHYLRKHRSKVKEYLGDDSRGPYRSTYCETHFTDGSPIGISVKTTKSDRIYVNAPDMQKQKKEDIQLLSFNSHKAAGEEIGEENKSLDTEENEDELDKNEEMLTPGDLMAFAWQISQGMEYLAKKGFVHRDLAARNVLVGENKIAKVADFGLTRHVYEEKVYHAKRNRKLPLKWMSIEAIFDQTFTAQSDVWAFGVVLWELVTLGGTPYPTIDNKELLCLLKDGYRMEKPDTCNDELYNMMIDCWKDCPEARPTFTEIRQRLEEMMQKDNPYLDLSVLDETREYYHEPSFNSLVEESTDDLFDEDDHQCSQDPNENVQLGNEKNTKDLRGNGTESLQQKDAYDDYGKIDDRDGKKVKINANELEMSLRRPAARGTAF